MSGLPNGWVQIALGDALQIQKGKKPIGLGPKGEDRSVPYINISAFETKQVEEYAPEQDVPRCKPSDTLLVWDGARAGLAGRGIGGFIGSTLARLTSDLFDSSYLYYFVHSNYGYLNTRTKGVGIPHIDPILLARIPFPLPPASEQSRIVAKLEDLLFGLDAGVAELKTAQKKLGQYRQSLLKAAVEGALTAEWRAKNTPSETGAQLLDRILEARRARWETKQLAKFAEQGKTPPKDWQKKYPEPVKPDTTDLPELPEGWVWSTTGLVAESIVPNRDKPLTFTGDIPWITTPDFEQAELHLYRSISGLGLSSDECAMYRARVVPSKGVIMTCVGRFGLSAVLGVGAVINQQLHAFIPEAGIRSEYLAYVIQAQRNWLERNATSTTIAYLNKEKCESLPVPLPPTNEQDVILNLLKLQLDSIAEQLCSIDGSLKKSTAQRQNILRAAFAGQLVPQDPSEEPAGVLLERIRAERGSPIMKSKSRGRKAVEGA